jgi:hypothetical protein
VIFLVFSIRGLPIIIAVIFPRILMPAVDLPLAIPGIATIADSAFGISTFIIIFNHNTCPSLSHLRYFSTRHSYFLSHPNNDYYQTSCHVSFCWSQACYWIARPCHRSSNSYHLWISEHLSGNFLLAVFWNSLGRPQNCNLTG